MAGKVHDRDRGYRHAQRVIRDGARRPTRVVVGFTGPSAEAKHGDDDFTVVDVAVVHEYGSDDGHVPERSMLRALAEEKQREHKELLRRAALADVYGKQPIAQSLEQVGTVIAGQVKERISNGIEPPLAESTIARKGSSTPLIDTAQLISSVTHEVRR